MNTNKLRHKIYMHYRNKLNALNCMVFEIKNKKNIVNNTMRTKTLFMNIT